MGERWKRRWQAGIEATRGTAVPATRRLYVIDGEANLAAPQLIFPEDRGDLINVYEANLGNKEITAAIRDYKVTFEDLIFWLSLALKGGVTPTGIDPYTWAFTPSVSTDDLKSATLEWADGFDEWQIPFGMCNVLTLRGTVGDIWHLSADLLGKDMVDQALTGALGSIVREAALFSKTQIFIDSATIGTTEVTGRLTEAEIAINNNFATEYFNNSLLMTGVNRGKRVITARLRLKFNSIAEYNNWLAETTRKIRVRIAGSDSPSRRIDLDLYGRWQSHVRGQQDNMIYADMELLPVYDSTFTAEMGAVVINHISAL